MPNSPLRVTDDNSTTPLKHDGDVIFVGTIRAGRLVHVGGALDVEGGIEPGQLTTGGRATVSGAITGSAEGRLTVGGDLRCASIADALVMGRGDVVVAGDVLASRVTSVGRLDVADGAIRGGDVSANGGVHCRTLGHADGRPTVVEAGIGRAFKLLTDTIAVHIEENKKRVAEMRAASAITPAKVKTMTAAEKEKATEMLYEANEIEATTASLVAAYELRRRLIVQKALPQIVVSDTLHAGVVLRFGPLETAVTQDIAGPVTVRTRNEAGVAEIVATTADGVTVVMPTRPPELAMAA